MKKFGGVILTAIGALFAVLALLTIRMAVKDTMTWGGDSTVWLIEILLFAVPAVACLTSGNTPDSKSRRRRRTRLYRTGKVEGTGEAEKAGKVWQAGGGYGFRAAGI